MSRVRERELKYLYALTQPPQLPEGWSLGEEAVPLTLQDTYLDHAGLLNARGWSLRRRELNGGETGYTLKRGARTVGALHNREEVEALARNASSAASSSALPAEISDLIMDEFSAEFTTQLQPTITLTQQRRTWPLMHTGATVAICSIDQVHSASDAWCELEIELLTSLSEEEVAQLAKELDDALRNEPGVSPSTESKAERARRLAL
jgi:inorganic triphosphatase YgiF